jgi:hypothetical protein
MGGIRMMKKLLSLALLLIGATAHAQVYNRFGPSNGIMVGDTSTFQTSAADALDVTALFTGICDATTFLRGDGTCDAVPGSDGNFTSNVNISKADARLCMYDSASDQTWFWRASSTDVFRLYTVSGSTCTTTGATIPILFDAPAGAIADITFTTATDDMVLGPTTITAISGLELSQHLLINDANPSNYQNESDAPADEKLVRWSSQAGNYQLQFRTDVNGAGSTPLSINRTGTTTDSFAIASTALTWNGNTLFSTANDGAGSGLDADSLDGITSGSYAQLAQVNIFTGNTQRIQNTSGPRWVLEDTDASADEVCWFTLSQNGLFGFFAATDANCTTTTGATQALVFNRTGVTIDSTALTSTAFTWNGNTVYSAGNDGTGSGLDADLLDGLSSGNFAQLSASNIFTGNTQSVSATVAQYSLRETGATADEGNWLFRADGDSLQILTASDAAPTSSADTIATVSRTGTTANNWNFQNDTVQHNGSTMWDAANDGSGSGLDADTLDALSSAAFAQLAANNTFTGNMLISKDDPQFNTVDTNAAANEQRWSVLNSTGQWTLRTRTDADGAGANAILCDRTGTTVDSCAFSSTALTWNSNTLFTTANDGSGSGLDADLLDGVSEASFGQLGQAETVTAIWAFNGGTSGASAPFTVDSTDVVTNLNADTLDGISSAGFATASDGTFSINLTTGCTTTPSLNFRWAQVGNMVTIAMTNTATCTSNSATTQITAALPVAIRPAVNQCVAYAMATDNGAGTNIAIQVQTDGDINFAEGLGSNCSALGWTAAGTKTLNSWNGSYVLN